jgi:hypothetical protein
MKLRIKGNSVRLRLLRSEVERLASEGEISESTAFGPTDVLRYTVKTDEKAKAVIGTFGHGEIAITMPTNTAQRWATSDDVSIETVQPSGDGQVLELLIEKDFVCLDRVDDPDRDDAFPNPSGPCS